MFLNSARRVAYVMLLLLTQLCYILNFEKSLLKPRTIQQFLGFLIESVKQTYMYILPEYKKLAFVTLKNQILSSCSLVVKTLQRFCGKCISMGMAIPGTSLFCREVNRAISTGIKNSQNIELKAH